MGYSSGPLKFVDRNGDPDGDTLDISRLTDEQRKVVALHTMYHAIQRNVQCYALECGIRSKETLGRGYQIAIEEFAKKLEKTSIFGIRPEDLKTYHWEMSKSE
jgi:hypothetical protein